MKITVRLFATLRSYGPEHQELEVNSDTPLQELIDKLAQPEGVTLLKIVNGEHVVGEYRIQEGEDRQACVACQSLRRITVSARGREERP